LRAISSTARPERAAIPSVDSTDANNWLGTSNGVDFALTKGGDHRVLVVEETKTTSSISGRPPQKFSLAASQERTLELGVRGGRNLRRAARVLRDRIGVGLSPDMLGEDVDVHLGSFGSVPALDLDRSPSIARTVNSGRWSCG
jgi:hypothetical protein